MPQNKQYRQGDILFVLIKNIPKTATLLNHRIIAEGEATGHVHEAIGTDCMLYEESGTKYLDVKGETGIVHEEHKPITLPNGIYRVILQREYDPRQALGRAIRD